jgi:uracil-DNA glycosylase family 4
MSVPASERAQVAARLRELRELGEDGVPRAPSGHPRPGSRRMEPSAPAAETAGPAGDWSTLELEQLGAFLGDCRRCKLCEKRTNVVFGVGSPTARLMFVGEGPGEDEDKKGEPFVGRAGQLLTDMIQKGMGLRRQDVYIANVVKCRPPGNRNPEPDEIAACSPFLLRQVALIQPEAIVALGKFAAQALLKTDAPIGKLRGRWHAFEGIPLMPTFHPAYLLRSPDQKKLAWEDLKAVMEKLRLR